MRKLFFLLLFALILLSPPTLFADDIPWQLIDGGQPLGSEHKELATKALNKIKGYAVCKENMVSCLKKYSDNQSVLRQAKYIVRRCKVEKNIDQIVEDFKKRMLSMYNPKKFKPDLSGLVHSGNKNAPVKVVVYADFECPYCRVAVPALRKISLERPDMVALYFKNFPIKSHRHALSASQVLVAADKQGKFWEMLDLMYKESDYSEQLYIKLAKSLKLNIEQFNKDRQDKSLIARIKKEKLEAMSFDIFGTPGILINGKLYSGPKTYEELSDILEEELDIVEGRQ